MSGRSIKTSKENKRDSGSSTCHHIPGNGICVYAGTLHVSYKNLGSDSATLLETSSISQTQKCGFLPKGCFCTLQFNAWLQYSGMTEACQQCESDTNSKTCRNSLCRSDQCPWHQTPPAVQLACFAH